MSISILLWCEFNGDKHFKAQVHPNLIIDLRSLENLTIHSLHRLKGVFFLSILYTPHFDFTPYITIVDYLKSVSYDNTGSGDHMSGVKKFHCNSVLKRYQVL